MEQYYELSGVVTDILTKSTDPKNHNVVFALKTATGTGYRVECPYFCPISYGDGCRLVVKIIDQEKKHVKVVSQPFVTLPMDKNNTIEFFIRTLKGMNFGQVSAKTLYEDLEKYAAEASYGEKFSDLKISTISEKYYVISNEDRYHGDGVIPYLSELAAFYCETKAEKVVDIVIGKKTETSGDEEVDYMAKKKSKPTITRAQARRLLDEWHNKRSLRKLYLLGLKKVEIANSGIGLDELYNICLENPYRIASINYEKCEKILNSVGKSSTEIEKYLGRINRFVYDSASSKGWNCVPIFIIKKTFSLYDQHVNLYPDFLNNYGLINVNDRLYTCYNYKVEVNVASYIAKLINRTSEELSRPDPFSPLMSNFFECKTLTEEQKSAINNCLKSHVSIISGGAGTGKSTTIREITRSLSLRGIGYIVTAFTGKAVSRLHQIMKNKSATTIDRFIGKTRERIFNDPKYDKSHIKFVIIDEASMVTTELFYRLLNQLCSDVRFIFVGDISQLPPIGPGSLMKELIGCGKIPTFYLTKNQRIQPSTGSITNEEQGSKDFDRAILENANALIDPKRNVNSGFTWKQGSGFYLLDGSKETVKNIVKSLKTKNIPIDDFVIISPYRKYLKELNEIVQDIYLPPEENFRYIQDTPSGGRTWCVGDRVLLNSNNYKINLFNGDQGEIIGIEDSGIKVKFSDNSEHVFKFSSVDDTEDNDDVYESSASDELFANYLSHGFAITTHKSQGSEYRFVILFLGSEKSNSFLNINLLYTSITRAKQTIWVVTDIYTLNNAAKTFQSIRYDGLAKLIKDQINEETYDAIKPYVSVPEFELDIKKSTTLTHTSEDCDDEDILRELLDMC